MAHFASYNTSDSTAGNAPLTAGQQIVMGPIQTDHAQKVALSLFADQPGTLYVEQSFDGGNNWDVSGVYNVAASGGQTTPGNGIGIGVDILAPWIQVRYVNGSTIQGAFRLFARTYTSGA